MNRGGATSSAAPTLPRQVKLFGWVSLLNDFASEMIYPLLPAFVTGVLGGGPGALGALDGAAEFAAAVVKLGAGPGPGPRGGGGAGGGRGDFTPGGGRAAIAGPRVRPRGCARGGAGRGG